jgi:tRNA (guanine-N7-)-methyltransferase
METGADDDPSGDATDAAPQDLRSYGRRRGRKVSPRQQRLLDEVLPCVAVDLATPPPSALAELFRVAAGGPKPSAVPQDFWLEIGFGGGEHLLWQARCNPGIGLIGAEPFEEGVVKVLSAIEEETLANVLVHPDDARDLLRWLPPASLSRVFILFPDPWPKRRHVKRRLVNSRLLGMLARVMRPGAELRIGTDIGDYARTILMTFQRNDDFEWCATAAADWRDRPADWPSTRYEQKALREGRRCSYLRFRRV